MLVENSCGNEMLEEEMKSEKKWRRGNEWADFLVRWQVVKSRSVGVICNANWERLS